MATVATSEVEVRAVLNEDELRRANELMARTHAKNYAQSIDWLESCGKTYPGFQREHTRVALRDGELAGALRLTTETVRLGEARLKMGGLGWVSTAPDHRHCGVCTALLRSTLEYMMGHGYHVSMLFGIPNFYHRFGYATTLAEYVVTLDAVEAATGMSGVHRIRGVKPGDLRTLQRIHAANDAEVSCSLLRTTAHFTNRWRRFDDAQVFTDAQGKVVGYALARVDDEAFVVEEVGVGEPGVEMDILAYCAKEAQDRFRPKLRFFVPPEHPMARFLSQFESVHEMQLSRQRGGMMTFVDIPEALESLIPEWEQRVQSSAVADRRCEVTLVVGERSFRFRWNRGALDIAEAVGRNKFAVTRDELMRLTTGYAHVKDSYGRHRRIVTEDGKALLSALFPKRNPYVHVLDRF